MLVHISIGNIWNANSQKNKQSLYTVYYKNINHWTSNSNIYLYMYIARCPEIQGTIQMGKLVTRIEF